METINEKSTSWLTIQFKDELANAVIPTYGDVRIDDDLGNAIRASTLFTPTTSTYTVTITSAENAILSTDNDYEIRIVTLDFYYGDPVKTGTSEYYYRLKNLKHYS
jgi:hypothetical protein